MKSLLLCSVLVLATACSSTRIAPIGPDTYLVQRKAGTGYSSASGLKMDALDSANEYCAKINKQMVVVSTSENAVAFASTPSAEVQFRCLYKGDAKLIGSTVIQPPTGEVKQ